MKFTCLLLGHKYNVKKDDKTIYCERDNEILAVAKKGYAWELSSIISKKRYNLIGLFLFIVLMIVVGVLG